MDRRTDGRTTDRLWYEINIPYFSYEKAGIMIWGLSVTIKDFATLQSSVSTFIKWAYTCATCINISLASQYKINDEQKKKLMVKPTFYRQ